MDGCKRKRRRVPSCPNPLFAQWIEEWRDEAIEKGLKSSYTYSKALNALKRYPLPLESGQEAKVLENIGDKIANMLDKKLREHLSNGGNMGDLHNGNSVMVSSKKPANSFQNTEKQSPKKVTSSKTTPVSESTNGTRTLADRASESESANNDTSSTVPCKRHRSNKKYVPAHRSGPYAILRALLQAEQQDSNFKGYLFKHELITAAQPLCDTSFTIPDPGSYYTAWNSSSTLIRKNLLSKTSHPPRYSLTEEGLTLALRIISAEENQIPDSSSPLSSRGQRHIPGGDSPHGSSSSLSPLSPVQNSGLYSRDCQNSGNYRFSKEANEVFINIDSSPVKTFYDSPNTLSTHHVINPTSNSASSVRSIGKQEGPIDLSTSDFEDDDDNLPSADFLLGTPNESKNLSKDHFQATHFSLGSLTSLVKTSGLSPNDSICIEDSPVKQKHQRKTSSYNEVTVIDSDDDIEIVPLAERIGLVKSTKQDTTDKTKENQSTAGSLSSSGEGKKVPYLSKHHSSSSSLSSSCGGTTSPSCMVSSFTNRQLSSKPQTSQLPSNPQTSQLPSTSSQTQPFEVDLSKPLVTLKPGEFEVILCIDNTESTASRKSTSQFRGLLLEELNKNGVKFSVRKLNVGDFLWIAQEIVKISHDQLRQQNSKEIVLEHIVERKRIDDLAGSIIDRRFSEQKFRMKNCGVYNPIYLVEEHGDANHCKLPESSLRQAVTNTQILDEFYIKEAKDIRESIAYLTVMTRYIQMHYSSSVINGYPVDTMLQLNKKRREKGFVMGAAVPGIPFTLFNESSVKTRNSSVSEMFGRHLIQIPNSSAEKAAAVLELYPTVAHLRKAYLRCANEREMENLLSSLRTGECKRRFGPLLSSMIFKLYWKGCEE